MSSRFKSWQTNDATPISNTNHHSSKHTTTTTCSNLQKSTTPWSFPAVGFQRLQYKGMNGASLGGPLCHTHNRTLRLFSRNCLYTTSDDNQTRPKHTSQRPNKHHHHGGGAANPSGGLDEPTLPEGWAALRMIFPRMPSKQFNRFNKLK